MSQKKSRGSKVRMLDLIRENDSWKLSKGYRSTGRGMLWQGNTNSGRFKISLYRFLRDNIPLLNSCVWTWSRLASAPGKFVLQEGVSGRDEKEAVRILEEIGNRIYPFRSNRMPGMESFLPFMYSSLFTDGSFAGFLILRSDGTGIERFIPVDPSLIEFVTNSRGEQQIFIDTGENRIKADGEDFYYFGLNADSGGNTGKSILASVPFVSYIQQQLIDDMRRTTHNAGYHRLHVKITPPERQSGEADDAYVERINDYFDETVSMIKNCDPEDNPVTWDNVEIEYVGPGHTRSVSNSWFLSHRAMIEEICAGTNLSPFMLGYSFGTTHNWAQFKYDLVMRQVRSVQGQVSRFLEWIGNIELALRGFTCTCKYKFDNSFTYLATEKASTEKTRTENLISLYQAGLISREEAQIKAGEFL